MHVCINAPDWNLAGNEMDFLGLPGTTTATTNVLTCGFDDKIRK
ncbi:hypothetical protein C900_05469 [Fulvivirga imtechensis AK7]|uniref:Uncharacterized protein n=1 Tax=Fulvivirga imtechensis AK7 TaxID=1237149 RepID=L8JJU2_9BACT|nr:hypothetical protein C900_05469 [Fulvivirga imtechensis AK7]